MKNAQCRKKRPAADLKQYRNPDFETSEDRFETEYITAIQYLESYEPEKLEEIKKEYEK